MKLTLEELNKTIMEMRTKGYLTEALKLADQGLLVALETNNYPNVLDLYYQKILVHHALGDTLCIVSLIHDYEAICQKYGSSKDLMHYYLVMSLIYDLVGIREKTVEMTKKSITYAHELQDPIMLVRCHNNLCYLEVEKGCTKEALRAGLLAREYNKSLARTLPDLAKLHAIRINNNLADVYILEGDFITGKALLDSTLTSDIIQHHKREKVAALFGYGFLYEKQNKLEEAVSYYKQAIELAQSYGDKAITKKVMRLLLNVLYQLDWRDKIFDVQREYIDLTEKMSVDNLLQQVMNLEFKRQKEKLEKKAHYDPLTGVLNRHFLDYELPEWLNVASMTQSYVCITVLDIDYFKLFNDMHGHLFGDRVLQLLANGLKEFLHEEDVKIIRYGGDEFILCMRHQDKDYIKSLVKNTHAYLLTLKLEQQHQSFPLKVSMGACVNDQKNYQFKELFELADSCLYQAKDNGRASYVLNELS
ncbi:tetratricopeptide repeat-containing diguanylate cyclase [Lysinibacillus cavernae]|uniref:tetratricopeptide repeat-containing diguanylate cyclase n=1 Tax=Lysinibacillus cavernae TaxID=2666135 RepID=UPI0012D93794|nr:tetratricopeptide repeat-containing diguanylate cyclase [Lysinibacillus cavernae]